MKNVFFAAFALFASAASADGVEAKERDVRVVDVEVLLDSCFWDERYLIDPAPGCVCCISAVTNRVDGGPPRWVTFDGRGWRKLRGEVEPVEGDKLQVRLELDFTDAESKIRYSVKRDGGEYAVLRDEAGSEWLPSPTPDKKTFTTVEVGSPD